MTSSLMLVESFCHHPSQLDDRLVAKTQKTRFHANHQLVVTCPSSYWLSVQLSPSRWIFTGDVITSITCNDDGDWRPYTDSFTCRRK